MEYYFENGKDKEYAHAYAYGNDKYHIVHNFADLRSKDGEVRLRNGNEYAQYKTYGYEYDYLF